VKIAREGAKLVGLIVLGLVLAGALRWIGGYDFVNVVEAHYTYIIVFVVWLILLFPVGEVIGYYLKKREPEEYRGPGLEEAGRVIGRLERTIILIFYLGGSLAGVGFLVVAKSIYRFGDLKKGYEKKTGNGEEVTFSISEYIILGSLLSYTAAMIGGIVIELLVVNLGLSFGFSL